MKQLLIIVMALLTITSCSCSAQEDYRERINLGYLQWYETQLAVSPKGQIALAADTVIYVTDAPQKGWQEIPMPNNLPTYRKVPDLCWPNERTLIAIVSADCKLYAWEKADDGTFKPCAVKNAPEGFIQNLYSNGQDNVWTWNDDNQVFYSSNGGRAWNEVAHIKELEAMDNESSFFRHKINDIHFDKDGKQGLIGSNSNELYLTLDNCKTLQRIPTPLDQKAYDQSEVRGMTPTISKVRVWGDHYLVEQDHMAFITSASDIHWRLIEGSDTAEYVDVMDNRFIVMMPDEETIRILDEKQNVVKEFDAPELDVFREEKTAIGHDFYIIDERYLNKCGIRDNDRYELFRIDQEIDPTHADEEPDILSIDGQEFYFYNYDLIVKSKATGKWYRHMTFDFNPVESFVDNGKALFYESDYAGYKALYQVNFKEKTIKPFEWPSEMFGHKKVVAMRVINTETCWSDSDWFYKRYRLHGDELVWEKDSTSNPDKRDPYPDMPKRFKASDIQRLVALIDDSRSHPQAYPDTIITDEDRAEYLELINTLQEGDDFYDIIIDVDGSNRDQWASLGQQITVLNESKLKQAREDASSIISTTYETHKIEFTFEDGSTMSCHNDKFKVSYLYSPWTITCGNYVYQTEDLNVGALINQITQGKMLDQRYCSKAYAIYQMLETHNAIVRKREY